MSPEGHDRYMALGVLATTNVRAEEKGIKSDVEQHIMVHHLQFK